MNRGTPIITVQPTETGTMTILGTVTLTLREEGEITHVMIEGEIQHETVTGLALPIETRQGEAITMGWLPVAEVEKVGE